MKELEKTEAIRKIRRKYKDVRICLHEKARRIWGASEAKAIGRGGMTIVHEATGLDYKTLQRGRREIDKPKKTKDERIRKRGGGRKALYKKEKGLMKDLDSLVEPESRGDPENPLRWTTKSTTHLAEALQEKGYSITQPVVWALLKKLGYSLQSNKKTEEGASHPDRDKQFHFINDKTRRFQKNNDPSVSVDTKKKENIGNYKNNGREYEKKGEPTKVKGHDFPDKKKGKIAPYGVYDLSRNEGWVNVGISSDTAKFAVNSIRTWWNEMGKEQYKNSKKLFITADCGGSNGNRVKLWKIELQKLANELNMEIHVSHFPPGTSKWNKIEHRMFSYISKNWRGKPLIDRATVVNIIANTTTKTGLKIRARLDENIYEKGIKISNEELEKINIFKYKFHSEWNYVISPKKGKTG